MSQNTLGLCRHSGRENEWDARVFRCGCHHRRELVSEFGCRLLAYCVVRVSWGGAAYVAKGADWVGAKRVTGEADGVTERAAGRARASVWVCCAGRISHMAGQE